MSEPLTSNLLLDEAEKALNAKQAEIERLTRENKSLRTTMANDDDAVRNDNQRLRVALQQIIDGASWEFRNDRTSQIAREALRASVETPPANPWIKREVVTSTASETFKAGEPRTLGPPDIICPKCGEYIMNPAG